MVTTIVLEHWRFYEKIAVWSRRRSCLTNEKCNEELVLAASDGCIAKTKTRLQDLTDQNLRGDRGLSVIIALKPQPEADRHHFVGCIMWLRIIVGGSNLPTPAEHKNNVIFPISTFRPLAWQRKKTFCKAENNDRSAANVIQPRNGEGTISTMPIIICWWGNRRWKVHSRYFGCKTIKHNDSLTNLLASKKH